VKDTQAKSDLIRLALATPDGEFVAYYSAAGLAGLNFPGTGRIAPANAAAPATVRAWHRMTATALQSALAGREPGTLPPLDLSAGTAFQQSVWQALRQIRFGQTRSYGEIARAIGKPRALRAVGGACGANPIPVLVPCHRVLAANQKIGGFSGGLDWKRRLLAREGFAVKS
jgi:O-6-methylguanine DNA methyltransferase